MISLSAKIPGEGEVVQYFTWNERVTACAIGRIWKQRGWNPTLMSKSHDGRFISLDHTLVLRKAA